MEPVRYEFDWQPTTPVAPIVGNTTPGAFCRIPGTNEAMWVAIVDGEWQAWRTTEGYEKLVEIDNSVTYQSTILSPPDGPLYIKDNPHHAGSLAALTVIDDVIYCSLSGLVESASLGTRYCRIYKSIDAGMSWQLHATLPGETNGPREDTFGPLFFMSQIHVMGNGRWVCCYVRWLDPDLGEINPAFDVATAKLGVAHSDDQGETWTEDLMLDWYVNGIYGFTASRNFVSWEGTIYLGASGNVHDPEHYYTEDGENWVSMGALGMEDPLLQTWPLASMDSDGENPAPFKLYRVAYEEQLLDAMRLRYSTGGKAAPDGSTIYSDEIMDFWDLGLAQEDPLPFFNDLNPGGVETEGIDHLWAASGYGLIKGLTPHDPLPPGGSAVSRSFGQISLVQYRYAPVSVNVGYEYGSVETFDYARATDSWTDRLTDAGVPIPFNDQRRP